MILKLFYFVVFSILLASCSTSGRKVASLEGEFITKEESLTAETAADRRASKEKYCESTFNRFRKKDLSVSEYETGTDGSCLMRISSYGVCKVSQSRILIDGHNIVAALDCLSNDSLYVVKKKKSYNIRKINFSAPSW